MQEERRPETTAAITAAKAAGEVLMEFFGNRVATRAKPDEAAYNLVTEADVAAEKAIVKILAEAFPNDAIYGEEQRRDSLTAERLWVIDPLDGTNNFVHDLPHFAVSIGFFLQGQPRVGVIWNPARGDLYVAEAGRGATHNGRPMKVSPAEQLKQVLAGVGFYYDRGEMMLATLAAVADLFREHVHGVRRFGTAALDLCQVASGQFGGFFEFQLSPWDFAAGWLIVQEAGGRITTCRNEPLTLTKCSVLASNDLLHEALHQIASRHIPDNL